MRALPSRLLITIALAASSLALVSSEAMAQRGGRGGFGGGFHAGGGRGLAVPPGRLVARPPRGSQLGGIGFGPGYGSDFGFARPQRRSRGYGYGHGGFGGGYRDADGFGPSRSGPAARAGIRPSPVAPPAIYSIGRSSGRGAAITADSGQANAPSGVVPSGPRVIRIGR